MNLDLATIDTNGVITALNTGETKIKVSFIVSEIEQVQTANVNIVDELDYSIETTRTPIGLTIARKTNEIEKGEEFVCQAYVLSEVTEKHPYPYGYYDDNLVKFTSNNENVCTVKNGVLKGISQGTATITVSDIDGIVSETFDVQVIEETSLQYTDDEVWTVNASDYDWSTTESTTLAIIEILSKATTDEMKKVVFPYQNYYVSPAYGTFNVPTQMILDFSNSVIQIEESLLTSSGYQMFLFQNTEYSSIENAIIYGERDLIDGTGAEGCQAIYFKGYNYKSGIKDSTISKSPGFNIGAINTRSAIIPFTLNSVESGAIDDNGQNIEEAYAFRNNGYINISSIESEFGFGNMQGYGGYAYLSTKPYDIYFYDSNYNFISCLKNCIQYYFYNKPSNSSYARIVYRFGEAPTECDPDYGGIAHIYSLEKCNKCYVKNCIMEDNYSTAIQPNGGESWVIEDCYFKDNGYRDPHSHIDWEDGRNNNKGHILRNCTFENGGNLMLVGADGTVIHNNIFINMTLTQWGEVQNSRMWLNQFIKAKVNITTKTDMVFSQNYFDEDTTCTLTDVDGTNFKIRVGS